jgi:septin 2
VRIEASTVDIEERGVKLRLTIVDTPGFGDAINSNSCFQTISQYVDAQFEKYLRDESGLNRRNIIDNRVHCCFYFVNPAAHGLRPIDIKLMKTLDRKVNIVPVVAKADTLTHAELLRLKKRIMDEIAAEKIQTYSLPDCDDDEDSEYKEQCRQLREAIPFAVIGSNTVIEVSGRKIRGRLYPWGVVEVENPSHCDFIKLRTMLVTHMQDLQEVTQEVHYENYRLQKLVTGSQGTSVAIPSKNERPEEERKLSERERELAEKEAQLRGMQQMLAKMQAEMQRQSASAKVSSPVTPDAQKQSAVITNSSSPLNETPKRVTAVPHHDDNDQIQVSTPSKPSELPPPAYVKPLAPDVQRSNNNNKAPDTTMLY